MPHQANVKIIQVASKRSGIPLETFYMNVEQYANTSTASIPIALNEMNEKGILNRGDNFLTVGFQLLDENLIHRSVQTSESVRILYEVFVGVWMG